MRDRQVRACYNRHRDDYRRRAREQYNQPEVRRRRNEYKRLWRKANPEKVRAQKKRYLAKYSSDPGSAYKRYHRRYRKQFAAHRRDLVRRATARRRRPIPDCKKCGKPTGWTPVSQLAPGRPWETCMRCAAKQDRKERRRVRREAAKRIARDPHFGLASKPARVRAPLSPAPRGPGDETLCISCHDIVVSHRTKKCRKCRQREVDLARELLDKHRGRGRRTDLARRTAA
ncbi:MAG: hypothetical protein ACJ8AK_03170 [Gemmatimonadaceae bacterium]